MAKPAWFFSTLAQVTAAIVGFIVAFSAGLYPLERQRREDRTDRLRNALIDFRNEYFDVIRSLSFVAGNGNVTTKDYLKDFTKDTEELQEEIENDSEQRGKDSALVWAHFHRIQELIDKIDAEHDFLLTSEELDTLQESIQWLYGYFDVNNEENKQFYLELSNLFNLEDVDDSYYHDNVYDSGAGAVKPEEDLREWVQEDSDGRHRNWAGYSDDDSGLTGKNLFTIATIMEYVKQDFEQLQIRRSGTILNYQPRIMKIIWGVVAMTFVGVFLPSILLLTPTEDLSPLVLRGWSLLASQWLVLILSTAAFSYLLYQIVKYIQRDVSVRDE